MPALLCNTPFAKGEFFYSINRLVLQNFCIFAKIFVKNKNLSNAVTSGVYNR
jgi:hypothetical protein